MRIVTNQDLAFVEGGIKDRALRTACVAAFLVGGVILGGIVGGFLGAVAADAVCKD